MANLGIARDRALQVVGHRNVRKLEKAGIVFSFRKAGIIEYTRPPLEILPTERDNRVSWPLVMTVAMMVLCAVAMSANGLIGYVR